MYKCIIVDDESLARDRLKKLLSKHSRSIKIENEFEEALSVLKYLKSNPVDFIFLDIEMPGLRGIDALTQIPGDINVVFTTAYKDFAIDAFEHDAFDYLLKPISQERLDKAIIKLMNKERMVAPQFEEKKVNKEVLQIPVSTKAGVKLVPLEDISFLESESKYVVMHSIRGEKYLLSYTLTELDKKINHFRRIHKSIIINPAYISEIKNYFNSKYKIVMNDSMKTELVSGRSYSKVIQSLIKL